MARTDDREYNAAWGVKKSNQIGACYRFLGNRRSRIDGPSHLDLARYHVPIEIEAGKVLSKPVSVIL